MGLDFPMIPLTQLMYKWNLVLSNKHDKSTHFAANIDFIGVLQLLLLTSSVHKDPNHNALYFKMAGIASGTMATPHIDINKKGAYISLQKEHITLVLMEELTVNGKAKHKAIIINFHIQSITPQNPFHQKRMLDTIKKDFPAITDLDLETAIQNTKNVHIDREGVNGGNKAGVMSGKLLPFQVTFRDNVPLPCSEHGFVDIHLLSSKNKELNVDDLSMFIPEIHAQDFENIGYEIFPRILTKVSTILHDDFYLKLSKDPSPGDCAWFMDGLIDSVKDKIGLETEMQLYPDGRPYSLTTIRKTELGNYINFNTPQEYIFHYPVASRPESRNSMTDMARMTHSPPHHWNVLPSKSNIYTIEIQKFESFRLVQSNNIVMNVHQEELLTPNFHMGLDDFLILLAQGPHFAMLALKNIFDIAYKFSDLYGADNLVFAILGQVSHNVHFPKEIYKLYSKDSETPFITSLVIKYRKDRAAVLTFCHGSIDNIPQPFKLDGIGLPAQKEFHRIGVKHISIVMNIRTTNIYNEAIHVNKDWHQFDLKSSKNLAHDQICKFFIHTKEVRIESLDNLRVPLSPGQLYRVDDISNVLRDKGSLFSVPFSNGILPHLEKLGFDNELSSGKLSAFMSGLFSKRFEIVHPIVADPTIVGIRREAEDTLYFFKNTKFDSEQEAEELFNAEAQSFKKIAEKIVDKIPEDKRLPMKMSFLIRADNRPKEALTENISEGSSKTLHLKCQTMK